VVHAADGVVFLWFAEVKMPTNGTAIHREIDATVRESDGLVYELYGLTDEEIRIVEEGTGQ
jgi:hypothetical protein